MGLLRNSRSYRALCLRPVHTFGRDPVSCRTVLQGRDVSQIHAILRWQDAGWTILDQSRNGTFVDGKRLERNLWQLIEAGCEVAMGDGADARWHVEDTAAPVSCIVPEDSAGCSMALPRQGMFLPLGSTREIYVHGHDGEWFLETSSGVSILEDDALVTLDGRPWRVALFPDLARTIASDRPLPVARIELRFELSQDEAHARMLVLSGDSMIDLGERVHHYSLATLARKRLDDARRGLEMSSQGWVPTAKLAQMLGLDVSYVNIQIFRARQQLAQAMPPHVPTPLLVERRSGELRLADVGFLVQRGSRVEGGLRIEPSGDARII